MDTACPSSICGFSFSVSLLASEILGVKERGTLHLFGAGGSFLPCTVDIDGVLLVKIKDGVESRF